MSSVTRVSGGIVAKVSLIHTTAVANMSNNLWTAMDCHGPPHPEHLLPGRLGIYNIAKISSLDVLISHFFLQAAICSGIKAK
jgi:hypothetical protein